MKRISTSISVIVFLALSVSLTNCGTENSAFGNLLGNKGPMENLTTQFAQTSQGLSNLDYYEEINEAVLTLPVFQQKQMNDQLTALKGSIENFIAAKRDHREDKSKFYFLQYQRDYKEVQKLKSYQTDENIQVLDVALVRIKTNMDALYQQPKK